MLRSRCGIVIPSIQTWFENQIRQHHKGGTYRSRSHQEKQAFGSKRKILEQEIGEVFLEVLCDAGVFKRNPEGQAAFDKFINCL